MIRGIGGRACACVLAAFAFGVGSALPATAGAQALGPLGDSVRVSLAGPDGNTTFRARNPSAAYAPAVDRVLVAWEESDPAKPDDELEIFVRVLRGDGTPVTGPLRVTDLSDASTDRDADRPAVAFDPGSGRFIVAYTAEAQANAVRDVFVQRVTVDGALDGAAVNVTDTLPGTERGSAPAIACAAGQDRCLIAFEHTVSGVTDPIAAVRAYTPSSATAVGVHTDIATTSGADRAATQVSVAATGQGFVVAWRHEEAAADEELYTRDVGFDGAPVTPQLARTTTGNVIDVGIAHGGSGGPDELLLTWTDAVGGGREVLAQRLDAGVAAQPPLATPVTLSTPLAAEEPVAAFEPAAGRWLVTFTGRTAEIPGLDPSKQERLARTVDTAGVPVGELKVVGGYGPPESAIGTVSNDAALVARPGSGAFLSVTAGDNVSSPGIAVTEQEVFARSVGVAVPSSPPDTPTATDPPAAPAGPAAPAPPVPGPVSVFDDPAASPADLVLACGGRPIVLIDVVPAARGRVLVTGVAQQALVGRRLTIRRGARSAGSATVRPDRTFRAVVAGPRTPAERASIRYLAASGTTVSRALKLSRRMTTAGLSRAAGRVVFRGRVLPPLGRPRATVIIERQTSCTRFVRVATVRPGADGRFTARFAAPAGAAVYRARTGVPSRPGSRRLQPTFTLPRPLP